VTDLAQLRREFLEEARRDQNHVVLALFAENEALREMIMELIEREDGPAAA
jgi:hypothetical protein